MFIISAQRKTKFTNKNEKVLGKMPSHRRLVRIHNLSVTFDSGAQSYSW